MPIYRLTMNPNLSMKTKFKIMKRKFKNKKRKISIRIQIWNPKQHPKKTQILCYIIGLSVAGKLSNPYFHKKHVGSPKEGLSTCQVILTCYLSCLTL